MIKIDPLTALGQVLLDGPWTAAELAGVLKGRGIALAHAATYVTLKKMQAEGLATSHADDEPPSEKGGRPRRSYSLTAKGRRRAEADRARLRALVGG